jgi:uncharacterized protein (TIGR04222 family)
VVGAERHHPVGILVFLLVVTAFAGTVLATRPTRTRAGKDVLQTLSGLPWAGVARRSITNSF